MSNVPLHNDLESAPSGGRLLFSLVDKKNGKRLLTTRVSPVGLVAVTLGSLLLVMLLSALLVMYTPLRELVPGYPNPQTRNQIINNALRADSLERAMRQWEVQLVNMQRVMRHLEPLTPEEMLQVGLSQPMPEGVLQGARSKEDSLLRQQVQERDRQQEAARRNATLPIEGLHFFPPVTGILTQAFNPSENHFAIDIATAENAVVSAVLDGTVSFASWTNEFGFVIQIQHANNLLSIYKHCAQLFKKVGQTVTAGSAIAIAGNTGTLSTGNHLHFELWHKGEAIDPAQYISF